MGVINGRVTTEFDFTTMQQLVDKLTRDVLDKSLPPVVRIYAAEVTEKLHLAQQLLKRV